MFVSFHLLRRSLAAALAAACLSLTALAQSGPAGTLTGTVVDQNGVAVPGASVTARHVGTDQTRAAAADAEGRWTLAGLPVGTYEVTFEAPDFKKTVQQNVQAGAAVPRTLDVALQVGDITAEVVNVTDAATALSTPDTAAVARQLTSEQLVAIPTSTRSFTQLLTGNAVEADTQFGITEKSFRLMDFSGFVADDWKLSRSLTLNLGLRYELFLWPMAARLGAGRALRRREPPRPHLPPPPTPGAFRPPHRDDGQRRLPAHARRARVAAPFTRISDAIQTDVTRSR